MAPMNRSAALSAAAQKLNKPQQIQGRDVTTENGQTGITGAHGGFQQLGQAAQAKLRGFGGGPTSQMPPGGIRTPPIMDPATLKPGGRDPATGGVARMPGGMPPPQTVSMGPGGPNVFHGTNPASDDVQVLDPNTHVPGGALEHIRGAMLESMNGGAPGMQTIGGPGPTFGTPGQQLGTAGAMDAQTAEGIHRMGGSPPPGFAQQASGMPMPMPVGGGPAQRKPLLRGFGGAPGIATLPTKPMPVGDAPQDGGGSVWGRIAGGGGRNPPSY